MKRSKSNVGEKTARAASKKAAKNLAKNVTKNAAKNVVKKAVKSAAKVGIEDIGQDKIRKRAKKAGKNFSGVVPARKTSAGKMATQKMTPKTPARNPLQSPRSNTKVEILNSAKNLLQQFGYNGFSFQHIADEIGIQKPSLYEHYRSKELLGEALIEDYDSGFQRWAEALQSVAPQEKLKALFELFFRFAKDHRKFCPLTALTVDCNALPKGMNVKLRQLHRRQNIWLTAVIEAGKKQKVFRSNLASSQLAELLMSLAYGAQLSARIAQQPLKIREACSQALKILQQP